MPRTGWVVGILVVVLASAGAVQAWNIVPEPDPDDLGDRTARTVTGWAEDPDGIFRNGTLTLPCVLMNCHEINEFATGICQQLGWTDDAGHEPCKGMTDWLAWYSAPAGGDGGSGGGGSGLGPVDIPVIEPGSAVTRDGRDPGAAGVRPILSGASVGRAPVADTRPDVGRTIGVALVAVGLVAVPLWLLYRRIGQDDLLANDLRRRILDHVREQPGESPSDVADAFDVHITTARYHLDLLCEFERLTSRRFGRRVRYFDNHGRYSEADKTVVDALVSDGRAAILRALARDGGLAVRELSDRVDRAESTVSNHLGALREADLVERERDGRCVRYDLPEPVRRAVVRLA